MKAFFFFVSFWDLPLISLSAFSKHIIKDISSAKVMHVFILSTQPPTYCQQKAKISHHLPLILAGTDASCRPLHGQGKGSKGGIRSVILMHE